jgi:hypothetical protein
MLDNSCQKRRSSISVAFIKTSAYSSPPEIAFESASNTLKLLGKFFHTNYCNHNSKIATVSEKKRRSLMTVLSKKGRDKKKED